jgi:hypothetical protein
MKRVPLKLLGLMFLLSSNVYSFDMPIEVAHTGDDTVGKKLVYFLKESIQASSSMHLYTSDDSLRIQLSIVTLEDNPKNPGSSSVYSVTWLWNNEQTLWPYYLTSSVGYCGSDRVKSCAESLTAGTYEEAEKIFKLMEAYSKSLEEEKSPNK